MYSSLKLRITESKLRTYVTREILTISSLPTVEIILDDDMKGYF